MTNFSPRQVKDFVKQLKAEAGHAWPMLGRRFQEALVAEKALGILGTQVAGMTRTDGIHELWNAMLVEAGLRDA